MGKKDGGKYETDLIIRYHNPSDSRAVSALMHTGPFTRVQAVGFWKLYQVCNRNNYEFNFDWYAGEIEVFVGKKRKFRMRSKPGEVIKALGEWLEADRG